MRRQNSIYYCSENLGESYFSSMPESRPCMKSLLTSNSKHSIKLELGLVSVFPSALFSSCISAHKIKCFKFSLFLCFDAILEHDFGFCACIFQSKISFFPLFSHTLILASCNYFFLSFDYFILPLFHCYLFLLPTLKLLLSFLLPCIYMKVRNVKYRIWKGPLEFIWCCPPDSKSNTLEYSETLFYCFCLCIHVRAFMNLWYRQE